MARSPANGEGSQPEATTLIFPKKAAWEELAEAKATAKKKASSANGTFSKVVARLVEEEHMDRRAARLLLALNGIEEDEDLHVTLFHLFDGIKKLGILKRAMAPEDLFDDRKIDASVADSVPDPKTRGGRGGRGKKGAGVTGEDLPENVTRIGDAARSVAESAGTA